MCRCTPEIRTPFCGKPGCNDWGESENTYNIKIKSRTFHSWVRNFCSVDDTLKVLSNGGCVTIFNPRTNMMYFMSEKESEK